MIANGGGTSAQSTEASATPKLPIAPTPTGVTATAGNALITLAWTASSGATSYNVYRSTATGTEGTTAYKTGITTASYTDTGLTNGKAYYYTVAAVNTAGTSADSTQVTATPSAAPPTPTGVAATAGSGEITITWKASAGATSYNVNWEAPGWTSYRLAKDTTLLTYTQTGLVNGTTYSFAVAAVGSGGTSANSAPVAATPVAAPSNIVATAGNGEVKLTWTATSGATSYDIYRSTKSGSEGTTAYKTGITAASCSDTGLTNGVTYYYEVAAVSGG